MNRIICVIAAFMAASFAANAQTPEAADEQAVELISEVVPQMTYKTGRLYLDGQKLSKKDVKEVYPEGYKKYVAGRITRGTGIGLTCAGAATLGLGTYMIFEGKSVANKGGESAEESLGNGLGGVIVIILGAAVDVVGAGVTAGGLAVWGSGTAVIKSTRNNYNKMHAAPAPELTFGTTNNGFGLALNF